MAEFSNSFQKLILAGLAFFKLKQSCCKGRGWEEGYGGGEKPMNFMPDSL